MTDSDDDWSIHDLDRAPEPPQRDTSQLSPRGSYHKHHHSNSSRRSSGGLMDSSTGSGRRHSNESSGGGRRYRTRGWGSSTGGSADANERATPPSMNIEAVMSFPPMSEEHLLPDEYMETSNHSGSGTMRRPAQGNVLWSDQQSPPSDPLATNLRPSISNPYLSNMVGGAPNSLPGESIDDGFLDDSERLLEEVDANHSRLDSTGSRVRLDPTSSRVRLDTAGSYSHKANRVRINSNSVSSRSGQDQITEAPDRRPRILSMDIASDSSFPDETENGGADEDDTEGNDSTTADTRKMVEIWRGFQLPYWLVFWRPNLHRVSTIVVTRAPCFICWGFRQPTDRLILARLNVMVSVLTLIQIGATIFMASVSWNRPDKFAIETLSEQEENAQTDRGAVIFNVWATNVYIYFTGMLAFINLAAAILTIRVVRNVNLVGAIRYLWVLLWIVPLQFQANIGLFDYFRVTDVWLKHYWRDPSMSWFRGRFCQPQMSADEECAVPLADNATETQWCLENYNSTSCADIRNVAQSDMEKWILGFYYANASVGLALICLLLLTVNILEHIISKPLVQKSRESNVPAWMSLPIISCVGFGLVFSFSNSSVLNTRADSEASWIGPLFLVAAGLFFVAAVLGWFISTRPVMSTRHKRNKLISIWAFIVLMIAILILLTTIFAACIVFSISLVEIPITDGQRGDVACFLDESGSCTGCGEESDKCPEWSIPDVTRVIQTQAKASASLAAMLMLYAFSALRYGLGMRKHIIMYQIAYI